MFPRKALLFKYSGWDAIRRMGPYAAMAAATSPVDLARAVAAKFGLPYGKLYEPLRMQAVYYPAWILDAQLHVSTQILCHTQHWLTFVQRWAGNSRRNPLACRRAIRPTVEVSISPCVGPFLFVSNHDLILKSRDFRYMPGSFFVFAVFIGFENPDTHLTPRPYPRPSLYHFL